MSRIAEILKELKSEFLTLVPEIESAIEKFNSKSEGKGELYSHKDTFLISYPDQFYGPQKTNLQYLNDFLEKDLEGLISHAHILPFYPWTSDDGFSPKSYHEVCEDYGSWSDVKAIGSSKMFDCVFNHLSSESSFFKNALHGDQHAEQMFHVYSEDEYQKDQFQEDIIKVVRPRITELFTPYKFKGEKKYVWTTFSADQVDTNLENIEMVRYILDSFFLYIENGASFFRIDAVPFMWKELGTNCSHLPKTHLFVKLLRAIVDRIDRKLLIVTESNVPHHENITYWGNGNDEAHVIYNFSLAPLLLHGLTFSTNQYLHKWAREVFDIAKETTYLNFTSTHDGIGMRGLEGIVPEEDVQKMCDTTFLKDGFVSRKRSRDGSEKPYELNITWASYLSEDFLDKETYVRKIVNSHAVVMFFPGIAAHYVHNFLGTENWKEGYEKSGIARRLNRKKLNYPLEYNDLSKEVMAGMKELIKLKSNEPLFSPTAGIKVLDLHAEVLSFERFSGEKKVSVLFNLSRNNHQVTVGGKSVELAGYDLVIT